MPPRCRLPTPESHISNRPVCPPDAEGSSDPARDALRDGAPALLPDLRAFARFLLRDPTQADDLVQETLVRALVSASQYRPGTNLKAWLLTIERNLFYEQARRRRREQALLAEHANGADAGHAPQDGRNAISDLQRLLWRLPPTQREALVLVGAQELDYDQAAAICSVPIGTMRARVSRARAALARFAAEEADVPLRLAIS